MPVADAYSYACLSWDVFHCLAGQYMYMYRRVALVFSCIVVITSLTSGFNGPHPRATNANKRDKVLKDAEKDFGPALGPSSSSSLWI